MAYTLAPLERLSEQLERLPGIGRRSAARLAFHLLYMKQADADALTDALARLAGDPERRTELAAAGRAWVEAERSWAANGPRYAQVYEQVLGARE